MNTAFKSGMATQVVDPHPQSFGVALKNTRTVEESRRRKTVGTWLEKQKSKTSLIVGASLPTSQGLSKKASKDENLDIDIDEDKIMKLIAAAQVSEEERKRLQEEYKEKAQMINRFQRNFKKLAKLQLVAKYRLQRLGTATPVIRKSPCPIINAYPNALSDWVIIPATANAATTATIAANGDEEEEGATPAVEAATVDNGAVDGEMCVSYEGATMENKFRESDLKMDTSMIFELASQMANSDVVDPSEVAEENSASFLNQTHVYRMLSRHVYREPDMYYSYCVYDFELAYVPLLNREVLRMYDALDTLAEADLLQIVSRTKLSTDDQRRQWMKLLCEASMAGNESMWTQTGVDALWHLLRTYLDTNNSTPVVRRDALSVVQQLLLNQADLCTPFDGMILKDIINIFATSSSKNESKAVQMSRNVLETFLDEMDLKRSLVLLNNLILEKMHRPVALVRIMTALLAATEFTQSNVLKSVLPVTMNHLRELIRSKNEDVATCAKHSMIVMYYLLRAEVIQYISIFTNDEIKVLVAYVNKFLAEKKRVKKVNASQINASQIMDGEISPVLDETIPLDTSFDSDSSE